MSASIPSPKPGVDPSPERRGIRPWIEALIVVLACTFVSSLLFQHVELANLAMIFLLGIVVVATRCGRFPSIFATIIGTALFDYFYVPPYGSLLTSEIKYLLVFIVMLVVGLMISTLTERARKHEQHAEHARMEVEVERQRNVLLSVVSHDLRTPLAAITGAATTLMQDRERLDDPTRLALLQSIASEASRLGSLVTNLLAMTRLEAGSVRPEKDWQPIEEVIGSALGRFEAQLQGRVVRTDVADDLPLVAIDPTLIEQVLANYLDNALKYTPPGSPLELRARAHDGTLTVEVLDWGPGLAADEESHVFDKFYRAAGSKGRVGSGLGLAICRGILAVHGGRTWVERRRDGTTFGFSLPLGQPPPPLSEEPMPAPASVRDSSRGTTLSPP
jgi:two-component system sensor histidine kinase KdpD